MEMGEMYKRIRAMEQILSDVREDASKFDRGSMLAGTRVTKGLQEIKKQAQEVRKKIFAIKKEKKKIKK